MPGGIITGSKIYGIRKGSQIFASPSGAAFALLTEGGAVVTWGNAQRGGDSTNVASSLTSGVRSVVGNSDELRLGFTGTGIGIPVYRNRMPVRMVYRYFA